MITLVIATRNRHKVEEIRAILGSEFIFKTLADFADVPHVVEDAGTFAGNATKKAVELARWLGRQPALDLPLSTAAYVLADDSGLEVDALNGAPGVHSARFAALDSEDDGGQERNSPDQENNAKLMRLLRNVPAEKRSARFRCVIAVTPIRHPSSRNTSPVCAADELELQTQVFDGACEGRIAFAPSGKGGFGYDPLFVPAGHHESFAELGEQLKNAISHRARALKEVNEWATREVNKTQRLGVGDK